jgi:Cu/Ag efflux pump CusA
VLIILCGLLATRLGSEFVPNLNEGDISIQALRIPGTSLSQSLEMQKKLEAGLKAKFPEIDRVFAHRYRRNCIGPNAAEYLGWLHHVQARLGMAEAEENPRRIGG